MIAGFAPQNRGTGDPLATALTPLDNTLRLDAEVLDFFKHGGKRYQSRINAVLRSYVEAQKAR